MPCPTDHASVTIYTKTYPAARFQPAEVDQHIICDDCGADLDEHQLPEDCKIKEAK
jgi:hypothetical protein